MSGSEILFMELKLVRNISNVVFPYTFQRNDLAIGTYEMIIINDGKAIMNNTPAFAWIVANAFGNFLGAGVWGFFHTLPQVNIYTHGTQFTSSHGHLAFWGAYATILIGMFYMGLQRAYGVKVMKMSSKAKWSIALLNIGMLGMVSALLISGYGQVLIERAQFGATWEGFFISQDAVWFVQGLGWRLAMGLVMLVGFVMLIADLLTIGHNAKHAES
jgi:nitric oxide reductase subunit B